MTAPGLRERGAGLPAGVDAVLAPGLALLLAVGEQSICWREEAHGRGAQGQVPELAQDASGAQPCSLQALFSPQGRRRLRGSGRSQL